MIVIPTPKLKAILEELPKKSKHRKLIQRVIDNRPEYPSN